MKKNPMKLVKQFLSVILTVLVVGVLFSVIFIKGGFVQPSPSFYKELVIVCALTLMMKIWWYDYAEDKRLNETDIQEAKNKYFDMVDEHIEDSSDLDKFLTILNKENRDHFITNKLGCRSVKTLSKKTFWLCLFNPRYRTMTPEEIGQERFDNLYYKIQRKADKLRQIKSEEIMALTSSETLYDSKNYANQHKRMYQIVTTVVSVVLTTVLAAMALEELMLNWINVFRYVSYLCSMSFTIASTISKAYKQTGDDTFDHLNRLMFIIDKYATYKEKEVKNGNNT
jgi:hypothetical protein